MHNLALPEAGFLPDWPALMPSDMAARYLSIDEHSFSIVAAAIGLHPVDLGLDLRRWRRRDLDKLVSGLPLKIDEPQPVKSAQGGLDEATLERLILRVQEKIKRPEKLTLSLAEAAAMTGLSRTTLWRLMSDGKLPSFRVGQRRLFKREDIDALLNCGTHSKPASTQKGRPRKGIKGAPS